MTLELVTPLLKRIKLNKLKTIILRFIGELRSQASYNPQNWRQRWIQRTKTYLGPMN